MSRPPAEAQRCTCPSGDGSLRWPCPAHPPEAQAVAVCGERPSESFGPKFTPEEWDRLGRLPPGTKLYTAPPSAPVGVEWLCRVYADAYHAGHHATVEGNYVDVLPVDRDTYWREKVEEDYPEALAAHQPAADSPGFTAGDMTDAAAQGFRDGVASVEAVGAEAGWYRYNKPAPRWEKTKFGKWLDPAVYGPPREQHGYSLEVVALAQQPAAVDEAAVERVAALLHNEATDEPWTVAGVEHDGPDREYYRELARKAVALAAQPGGSDND